MTLRPETVAVLPSPKRLIEALRDVGYDFTAAVADLVDNSLAASATRVDIQVRWDGADSWVRIADDGVGMNGATITEALRFGSERSYRPDDLGKFGLGLKTASLSQCRQILADRPEELIQPLAEHPGTVVVWSQLDRLLGTRTPRGERTQRSLWDQVESLEQHLGMVFHRFIEGDVGGRRKREPLVLTLNENTIQPWNPFAVNEEHTEHLQVLDFDISVGGSSGVVTFDPWVLPAKDKFSSEAEFNRLSGPARWNQQQGLYVYRANRLIQSGGWSRLRAPDEHTKLARAALDFYPELDGAFGINIAKMRVSLPQQLRERLRAPIEDQIRVAKRAYNPKSGRKSPPSSGQANPALAGAPAEPADRPHTPPPAATPEKTGHRPTAPRSEDSVAPWPPPPLSPRVPPRKALEKAASATGDEDALERIVKVLAEAEPGVARDLGW